jgi:hypothetical protein
MSDNIGGASIRWTQSARRHHIGKASARHVIMRAEPTRTSTLAGAAALFWVGTDERGRELEIIAVEVTQPGDERYLLVIHVMPTQLKGPTS